MASNRLADLMRVAERVHVGCAFTEFAIRMLKKIAACDSQTALDALLATEMHNLSTLLAHRGRG